MDMHFEPTLNKLFRLAVIAGVETAVKIHIRRGDDLNARDSSGMTPLMLAASKNKASVCSLLLAGGADPELLDGQGRDALAIARASKAVLAVTALEDVIAAFSAPTPLPVQDYAPEAVREPEHAPDLAPEPAREQVSVPERALLKMAVLAGADRSVKVHIRRGDDLDTRDSDGMTPLMLAASRDRASVCSLLLEAGAEASLRDASGRDALRIARESDARFVAAVLERASEPPVFRVEPKPAMWPESRSDSTVGAKPRMTLASASEAMLLKLAVRTGVERAVETHIRFGDDLNARDALEMAKEKCADEVVAVPEGLNGDRPVSLSNHKPDLMSKFEAESDSVLLQLVWRNGSHVAKAVKSHIGRGGDPNVRGAFGGTPLILAATNNNASVCSILLEAGADPRLRDEFGRDALYMARQANAELVIAMLLDALEATQSTTTYNVPKPEAEQAHDAREAPSPVAETPTPPNAPAARTTLVEFDDEWEEPDLSRWEAVHDAPPPENDTALVATAALLHGAISAHVPVDDAEGWGDFDAFLPERAAPLPGTEGEEESFRLRRLLLRAVREGGVPERDVLDASSDGFGNVNPAWETLLRLALGELGAETDDREESGDQPFMSDGSEFEDVAVTEALSFIEDVGSGRNEPGRFYSKEMRVGSLLTAEEESRHGREMSEGLAEASRALASWRHGLEAVVKAAELVRAGKRSLGSVSVGSSEPRADEAEPVSGMDEDESEEFDEEAVPEVAADFLLCVDELAGLLRAGVQPGSGLLEEPLVRARLSAGFLRGLDTQAWVGGQSDAFRAALARHDMARETMVLRNLRLVFSVVKRYQGFGLPIEDLVQEGNVGLIRAVEKYDWRKGFRFSTYATWWIRQQATRSLADLGRTIRLPVHLNEKIFGLRRQIAEFESHAGHPPGNAWLAERLGMSAGKVSALLARMEEPVPLHEPDEFGAFPEDSLVDDWGDGPEARAVRVSLIKTLGKALSDLDPRVAEVLTIRYGLDGADSRTLEETGEHFGVTRERIRQIEAQALRKLGHKSRSRLLAPFLRDGLAPAAQEDDWAEPGPLAGGEPVGAEVPRRGRPPGRERKDAQPSLEPATPEEVELVLASARDCGAVVEDSRGEGGGVVVRLPSDKYSRMKRLARDLVFAGFSPHPGMTFRK